MKDDIGAAARIAELEALAENRKHQITLKDRKIKRIEAENERLMAAIDAAREGE